MNNDSPSLVDSIIQIMNSASWPFTFLVLGGTIALLTFLHRLWVDGRNVRRDENSQCTKDSDTIKEMCRELEHMSQQFDEFKASRIIVDQRVQRELDLFSDRVEKLMDLVLKLFSPNEGK